MRPAKFARVGGIPPKCSALQTEVLIWSQLAGRRAGMPVCERGTHLSIKAGPGFVSYAPPVAQSALAAPRHPSERVRICVRVTCGKLREPWGAPRDTPYARR